VNRRRRERRSSARRRAETHVTGFQTSTVRMPEGMSFYGLKAGVHNIDIVPFVPNPTNPFYDPKYPDDLHYERTYWQYRNLGPEGKAYVALCKLGKRDPVQDWLRDHSNDPSQDQEYIKNLVPKERQLFFVHDHAEPGKLKVLDVSFHNFGKLLDSRIKTSPEDSGWDEFYFADDGGSTLRITVEEASMGGGRPFCEVTAIDFLPRKEGQGIPKQVMDQVCCLDDLLVVLPYDKLRTIFLGGDDSDVDTDGGAAEQPATTQAYSMDPPSKQQATQQPASSPPAAVEQPTQASAPATAPSPQQAPQRTTIDDPLEPTSAAAEALPKASDYGIAKGDDVHYQGKVCTVMRVSPDGTSLTLVDSNDDVIKAVSPDDVLVASDTPVQEESPISDTPVQQAAQPAAEETPQAATESFDEDQWAF
jgi:hypothetical protein